MASVASTYVQAVLERVGQLSRLGSAMFAVSASKLGHLAKAVMPSPTQPRSENSVPIPVPPSEVRECKAYPWQAVSSRRRLSRRVAIDTVRGLEILAIAWSAMMVERVFGCLPLAGETGLLSHWAAGLLVGWGATTFLARHRLYDPSALHSLPQTQDSLGLALGVALAAFAALAAVFGVTTSHMIPWLLAWGAVAFVAATTVRAGARVILGRMSSRGLFDTNIAVIGASTTAEMLCAHLKNNTTGLRLVGVYDDRGAERTGYFANARRSGTCKDLIASCRAGNVDRVIVALTPTATTRIANLAAELERLPVTLDVATHLSRDLFTFGKPRGATWLGPIGLVSIKTAPLTDWGGIVKSALDYCIAIALIPVLLPLFMVIAVLIKLDSPGPVFFKQSRKGFNQRPFRIWKFRSMSVMEDGATIHQATKCDPRVTRVGAVLRRTSLDELPQILNVLRGEMSIIGPRPHALAHDRQWEEDLFRYAGRQQVKPGITGWAQVHGLRGEIDGLDKVKARVDFDLDYIRNWSIWLDLKILAMTPWHGFVNKNAY